MCYKTKHHAPKCTKIKTANFYILLQIISYLFQYSTQQLCTQKLRAVHSHLWRAAYKSCLPKTIWLSPVSFIFPVLSRGNDCFMKHKYLQNFQLKYCKTMKQHLAHTLTPTVRKINLTFNALWKVEMESSAKSCCSSA